MTLTELDWVTTVAISKAYALDPNEISRVVTQHQLGDPSPRSEWCSWPVWRGVAYVSCSRTATEGRMDGIPTCWQHRDRFRSAIYWWLVGAGRDEAKAPLLDVEQVADALLSRAQSDERVRDLLRGKFDALLDTEASLRALWGETG